MSPIYNQVLRKLKASNDGICRLFKTDNIEGCPRSGLIQRIMAYRLGLRVPLYLRGLETGSGAVV